VLTAERLLQQKRFHVVRGAETTLSGSGLQIIKHLIASGKYPQSPKTFHLVSLTV